VGIVLFGGSVTLERPHLVAEEHKPLAERVAQRAGSITRTFWASTNNAVFVRPTSSARGSELESAL